MALTIDHFKVYLLLLCRVCNFISPQNWSFLIKSHFSIKQFYATVGEGLKKIYEAKLLPLEEAYEFHEFISPPLNEPDFDAKPMIMFVGQYSTGKTSLIRYLLERDYPGLRIGPEPTTDCFNAVMYGDQEQARILKRGFSDRLPLLW